MWVTLYIMVHRCSFLFKLKPFRSILGITFHIKNDLEVSMKCFRLFSNKTIEKLPWNEYFKIWNKKMHLSPSLRYLIWFDFNAYLLKSNSYWSVKSNDYYKFIFCLVNTKFIYVCIIWALTIKPLNSKNNAFRCCKLHPLIRGRLETHKATNLWEKILLLNSKNWTFLENVKHYNSK